MVLAIRICEYALTSLKQKNKLWEELVASFLSCDIGRIENDDYNNSSLPRERVYRAIASQR
jgi:hypothetical protein